MPLSWHERARLTRELRDLLDALLADRCTREDVERWAMTTRTTHRTGWPGAAFLESLVNACERVEGRFILRTQDFEDYARSLREGVDRARYVSLLVCNRPAAREAAEQLGAVDVRDWVSGLGWFESFVVGSPATGHRFVLFGGHPELSPWQPEACFDVRVPAGVDVDAYARDAIETFALADEDITHLHPEAHASTWPRYAVVRQDDHGTRYDVVESRSRSHALARLARFEALGHKQTYELEERPPAPFVRPASETV